jgi:RND family efflux transporter MFP subunit
MSYRFLTAHLGSAFLLGSVLGLTGCARTPDAPPTAPTPVSVSYPIERTVTNHAEFPARTAAVDAVEVRAHVWGYLDKVKLTEGAFVKKDSLLYEIDPRPYQAALNQAQAKVALDEAQLRYNEADYNRQFALFRSNAVSKDDVDKSLSARDIAAATVGADKATLLQRQLDLDFTKVTAPISGRVSRTLVTPGNLVQSGDQNGGTLLTTIVSVDPVYAYFDVEDRTVQRVQQLFRADGAGASQGAEAAVTLALPTEEGYPHEGTINFVDNQVNPKTGTLRVRGVFPNRDESLTPGLFVRVRVPTSEPHKALLITDRAIDTDQGQKIVYVVNDKNEVVSRPIRAGALHDGLREIEDGLKPGDRVIVNGLQLIRPGAIVEPTIVDMPSHGPKSETRRTKSETNPKM